MKRFLLILLLVLVPFQFAWATAGSYCQHETGASSVHFGHHAHQHQGKADTSNAKAKLGKIDIDCPSCHGAGCALFLTHVEPVTVPLDKTAAEPRVLLYTSHIPDGPRRPDRSPVA